MHPQLRWRSPPDCGKDSKMQRAPAVGERRSQSTGAEPVLGAQADDAGAAFRMWAPSIAAATLVLERASGRIELPMTPACGGWFDARVGGISHGERYRYRLGDGPLLPDPASRFQPE